MSVHPCDVTSDSPGNRQPSLGQNPCGFAFLVAFLMTVIFIVTVS